MEKARNSSTSSSSSSDNDLKSFAANDREAKSNHRLLFEQPQQQQEGILSEIEEKILNSMVPIDPSNLEEISGNESRSILFNKSELMADCEKTPINSLSLSDYPINEDENPIVVNKPSQPVEFTQEVYIRYLRPATPPEPGEIIIQELASEMPPPAPPVIIRQVPPAPFSPEPLVFREAPPPPPPPIGRKLITIQAKKLPPPPRKVIFERLAPVPPRPQAVLIERWLPYPTQKRRVIFKRSPEAERDVQTLKPKNVIIQWDPPKVQIRKKILYLGVVSANPDHYRERFANELVQPEAIPEYLRAIKNPEGLILAAEEPKENQVHELYGDVDALKLIDLDNENLAEYKPQLEKLINSHASEYFSAAN